MIPKMLGKTINMKRTASSLGVWVLAPANNCTTRRSRWCRPAEEFCKPQETGRRNVWKAAHISTFRLGDTFLVALGEVEDGRADFLEAVEAPQHADTDLLREWVGGLNVARHGRCAVRAHHFIGLVGLDCCRRERSSLSGLSFTVFYFPNPLCLWSLLAACIRFSSKP